MSLRLAAAVVASALLAGCGGGSESGAPKILYGEDICDRCRMVISERRHAAAASLEGRHYRFDDPGCLRRFVDAQSGPGAVEVWVHDETESWLPVGDALFVLDPERGTPMASGILAFGSATAAAAGERYGVAPVRWSDLAGYSW